LSLDLGKRQTLTDKSPFHNGIIKVMIDTFHAEVGSSDDHFPKSTVFVDAVERP